MWKSVGWALVTAGALMMGSCGGSGNATAPTTAPSGPAANGASGTLITITSAGVNPKNITVGVGAQVTFVNNDAIEHQMYWIRIPSTPIVWTSTRWDSSHRDRVAKPAT